MKCRNCEREFQENDHYCGNCGQKLALSDEFKFGHVLGQFFGNVFSFDSKVFKTLGVLFIPGKYYTLFRDGKRARFMHPLRLFIFLNIFLFGLMLSFSDTKLSGGSVSEAVGSELVWGNDTISPSEIKKYTPDELLLNYPQETLFESLAFRQVAHLYKDSGSFVKSVTEKLPWLFFIVIPLIALFSRIMERKHKALYLHHFLFWINVISAFILVNSIETLVYFLSDSPHTYVLSVLIFCPLFTFWSLQRVYPTKGFVRKILKWILYTVFGCCAFVLSMTVVLTLSFFMF
jgi:hypothetical protein